MFFAGSTKPLGATVSAFFRYFSLVLKRCFAFSAGKFWKYLKLWNSFKPCSEFRDRDRDRDARPGQDLSSFPFFNGFCSSNLGFFHIISGVGPLTTC